MKLNWLYALRAIVETGTMTKAADQLCVTQPAVSRMISDLQYELGFSIFVRRGGRLEMTPEGQVFYPQVERVLSGMDDIESIAKDVRAGGGRHLRIITMSPIANEILPEALSLFALQFPSVRVLIDIRSRREITQWISQDQYDLGIVLLPIESTVNADSQAFSRVPLVTVMSESHPLASHKSIRLSDLLSESLVMLPTNTLMRRWIDTKFGEYGIAPKVAMETSSMHSACRIAVKNNCVTIVDAFTAVGQKRKGTVLRPLMPTIEVTFGFVFPSNRKANPMVPYLMDCVKTASQMNEFDLG
tara:strand:+ start:10185 stop:11087 length:903 start_codon:yes stop_codon:yes gene_type:complete